MKQKKNIKTEKKGNRGKIIPGFSEKTIALVRELAEPLCESEGLEFVHVEFQRESGGRILRLYIDKPGGARLDDCVRISRQIGDLLDVYLENEIAYNLEVSTPGSERPLGKAADFDRFKGKSAKIRTRTSMEGRKNFTGKLLGISEGIVSLELSDITVAIPYEEISKARLVINYGENECL